MADKNGTVPVVDALNKAFSKYDGELRREPNLPAASAKPTLSSMKPQKPVPAPRPKPSEEGITRPNGEVYLPRKITKLDTTDVAFVQTAYDNRMPVLLYGSPGTGKTALFEAALPGLITMMGTSETETADFIGTWVQNPDGKYEWVDGPLVQAMDNGLPFLIDEIALIDARTMSVVYSVMDGRDELPVTANPARGVVKVKDGFCVYGACNPNVPGAIMSDALLSRFKVHVEVTTDWDLATRLGVGPKVITVAKNLAHKQEAGEVVAAPQLREMLTFMECVKVYGEKVAIRNFVAQSRPEDQPAFIAACTSVFGSGAEPLAF
jgi:MoxR-like ATPase